jgi:nicotinate phosphoribosyltransferase
VSNPGPKKAWRIYDHRGRATADLLGLADENPDEWDGILLHHPSKVRTYRSIDKTDVSRVEALHVEVLNAGKLVYDLPSIDAMRAVREKDIDLLDPGVRRIVNPHIYHVSLTQKLWDLKQDIIQSIRV